MKWTDQRASLLQELLSAMRVIKYFCYEIPFLESEHRILHSQQRLKHLLQGLDYIRHQELIGIRKILIIKALNQAIAFSVPALASILAFAAYTLSGHPIDPAVIFTSLALFQLLRQPLMFLPRA
jgi:ATP-binding cassette subfamily C (CFTR/MRP) protein 1